VQVDRSFELKLCFGHPPLMVQRQPFVFVVKREILAVFFNFVFVFLHDLLLMVDGQVELLFRI
jgi:hypothetical protein